MIAAIYARKSTAQDVADDAKSVTRQIDNARAFAVAQGWTVDERFIYADDGISGTETTRLVEKTRMVDLIVSGSCPFDVLVIEAQDRLSRRDGDEAFGELKRLAQHVEVWFYADRKQFTYGTFESNITGMLQGEFAAQFRRVIAQKVTETMVRKAKAGHVTGGRAFGYDNVDVFNGMDNHGRPLRSHVERKVNEAEAAIVRRIFALCAKGLGLRTIAKLLNSEGVLAPRSQQGRPRGWAPSSVREVLYRPLYRGQIVWNRTKKRDKEGQKKPKDRPESEWLTIDAPALRIISEADWQSVHARLDSVRRCYVRFDKGRLGGRPQSGIDSKYLLTGLARCAECGGSLTVRSRRHGHGETGRRAYFYACSSFHHRGSAVCTNGTDMPLAAADEAVLNKIEAYILDPSFIEEAVTRSLAGVASDAQDAPSRKAALRAKLAQCDDRLGRLIAAVARPGGGDVDILVQAMRQAEADRKRAADELAGLERPAVTTRDANRLRATIDAQLKDWRGLLRQHTTQARQMIRKLVDGRIAFRPDPAERSWDFSATGTLDKFFSGLIPCPQTMASPPGFERDGIELYRAFGA